MHFPMWGVWIYDNSDNRDNKDNCEMCMDNGINIDRRVKSERIRLIRILEIMASDEKLNTDFTDLNWYKRQQRQSMGRAHPICMSEMQGKAELRSKKLHQSYILHLILHPILHPKSPINTGCLGHGCRKCRIFSKTFFREGGRLCFVKQKHGWTSPHPEIRTEKGEDATVKPIGSDASSPLHSALEGRGN